MNASPGRLMQSSVTSELPSRGRSARSVRLSADESTVVLGGEGGAKLIYRSEIQVAGDQYLNSIALMLDHRRRNVNGAFQHFRHHILGRGGVDDHRTTITAAGNGGLNGPVDHRNQDGGAKALPKVVVDSS